MVQWECFVLSAVHSEALSVVQSVVHSEVHSIEHSATHHPPEYRIWQGQKWCIGFGTRIWHQVKSGAKDLAQGQEWCTGLGKRYKVKHRIWQRLNWGAKYIVRAHGAQ
eukprot:11089-Pelagomonas_calceolata.AAC.11